MATQRLARELRVVVEEIVRRPRGSLAAYTRDLVHLLTDSQPPHFEVEVITASGRPGDLERVLASLPPVAGFQTSFLSRTLLELAWSAGIAIPIGYGMTHAPSLFAPTIPHDSVNDPGSHLVVTLHDLSPWRASRRTWSDTIDNALLRRAWRHADAVIVPTHAMANALAEIRNFGTRVHVIAPAVSSWLWGPPSTVKASPRTTSDMGHDRYVLVAPSSPYTTDIETIVTALAAGIAKVEIRVWVDGDMSPTTRQRLNRLSGADNRLTIVSPTMAAERAALVRGAEVVIDPSTVETRPQALIDALCVGVPTVVADSPGLVEIAGGASLAVPVRSGGTLDEDALVDQVSVALRGGGDAAKRQRRGFDRSQAFEPQDVGRRLWRLHGDLVAY